MSLPTRPIRRSDVLAATMGVGTGPVGYPPTTDAIAYAAAVATTGLGGVGGLPTADSVQGLIDSRRSNSTRMATVR
jgi:hypothetical protein